MAKRYITRIGDWPEKPRKEREIITLLDEGELSPKTEVFDETTGEWRPLDEVEPFAGYLRREEELRQTLSPEELAKRKGFQKPLRSIISAAMIIGAFLAALIGMSFVADAFAEGLGGLPEGPSGDGEILWVFEVGMPVGGSPFHHDGSVYFGAEDGFIYRVDALTGEGIWRFDVGRPILGEVLIVDGLLYVGTCANGVWCLDAESGERLWTLYTGHFVGGGVYHYDGRLYFGSYDRLVYCVDALTGELLWTSPTGDWVFSTPFVADGRVYVGSYDGHLYCLDAVTGERLWRYRAEGGVRSSPYVADGRVYFGADDSRLHCLDAESGERLWRFRDPDIWNYIRNRLVVFDGRVYFGSLNNQVYAVDAEDGSLLWRYKTMNTVEAGGLVVGTLSDGRSFAVGHSHRWIEYGEWPVRPVVERSHLLIGSADSGMYCLDAVSGSPLWFVNAETHILTDPAWHDDIVYFGSQDGRLYAARGWPEGRPARRDTPADGS